MKKFTRRIPLILLALVVSLTQQLNGQSIINPADSVITYNAAAPAGSLSHPNYPPWGTIGKWIRTVRLTWNTSSWKCYILNTIPFRVKFPKSYTTANDGKKYPMLVFFHGAGEAGPATDNEYSMANGGPVFTSAVDNGNFDGFIVIQQSPGSGWSDAYMDITAQIIDYMIANNKVDPFRVSDNGLSAGGGASWSLMTRHPNYVASALPMSSITLGQIDSIKIFKYTPVWDFQGGQDKSPDPNTAAQVKAAIDAAGGNFKYTLYPTLGHGTWTTAWNEPDFFPFVNRAYGSNPWPLFGRTAFCPGDPINVTLGVAPYYNTYQWRKDGVLIQGASTNSIVVTQTGTYDCRILRGVNWSDWSHTPVVISIKQPTVTPPITVAGLMSKVIPAVDVPTVNLRVPGGYASYVWQKVGDTTTIDHDSLLTVTTPGNYIAKVTEQFGCSSSFSSPFTVVNAAGPNKPDPASGLLVSTVSQTALLLNWSQNPAPAHNETNFEIYQATQSGGPYKLAFITNADVITDTIAGLNAGTKYYFVVRAVDNTGAAAISNEASGTTVADVQPPTAPGNLTITGSSANSVSLSWGASTDNVGVTGYAVYVNGVYSYPVPANQTTFTVFGLTHKASYAFVIKAKDLAGNLSPASNQVSGEALLNGLSYNYYSSLATTLTKLPNFTTLAPAFSGTSPNVSLSPATETINYGFLWQGFINITVAGNYQFRTNSDDGSRLYLGSLNGTTSPYNFSGTSLVNNDGLHGGQNATSSTVNLSVGLYPIAIAYFQQGGGAAMSISWSTPSTGSSFVTIPNSAFMETAVVNGQTPAAPSNLVANAISYKAIGLTWVDNSNNETGFEVWRSISPSTGFNVIGTTAAGVSSYIDSTGAASTAYYYRLRAVNLYGQSPFTDNYTEAEWKFNNNYNDSSGNGRTATPVNGPVFDTDKKEGTFSIKLNGTNQAVTLPNTNGFLQEAYAQRTIAFWMKASTTTGTNRVIFDIGGTDNGISLELNNNTLVAAIANGNSTRVNFNTPFTSTGWNHIAVVYNGDSLLLYINGVIAASNISLSFHSLATSSNAARIGQTNGNNALNNSGTFFGGWIDDFSVFNMALSTDVIATLINGNYKQSNATTQALPAVPAAPTALTATAISSSAINVTWTNNAVNATNYQVFRSNTNNQTYVLLATLPANAVSFNDAGLFSNVSYYYKVNAINAGGASAYSNEGLATTKDIPPVITKLAASQQVRYSTTTNIALNATSVNSGPLNLQSPNLPAFAALTNNGDGTGKITLTPAITDQGVYNGLMVIVSDAFGGKDTTIFNLTVNNNYAPTIDTVVNYTLNENDSVSIPLTAHDQNGADVLTFSVTNLPSAFTITPGSNGAATLLLHPGYAASGTYAVNVNVADNNGLSATRQFTLTVNEKDPNTKIYARVKYANTIGAPWNSMTGISTPNLLDQKGNTTSVGINFLQSWWMPYNAGPTTGNNSGVYPDAVLNDFWYFGYYGGPETASLAVTGLNPAGRYNLTFYGGSVFIGAGDNGTTIYTVGSQSVSLYVQGNTQNTVTIGNLSPDASGNITVNMKKAANTPIGYLNALVITAVYDDGTPPAPPSLLTAQNVSGQGVQLNWKDAAYNETGYEIYRGSTISGTYSLIGTQSPGGINFLDSTVSGGTQYFYTVRAVNSHGASGYTDTANVATADRIPQIAAIADVTVKNTQSINVNVSATDDASDHITLTATGLPAFASFVDNGNGTGTVSITPTPGLLGAFKGITITAKDNSDSSRSTSFNIFVVDANVSSTYVDITNFDNLAPAPWNNLGIPFLPYAGLALSGLKDDGNINTGITVTLTDAWTGVSVTGMRRRNGSELYPEEVSRAAVYTTDAATHRITVTGLNTAKKYNFQFYSSHGTSESTLTNFTINGATVSLNGSYNSNKTVQINGVSPDGSGTVVINCVKDASAVYGMISALVIQSYTPGAVTTFAPADLRDLDYAQTNTIALQWQDRADNETGYEVWRAPNGGSYSLRATLPANSTSYLDAGLTSNTIYNYTVRAVNGGTYSGFSNALKANTYATTAFINFNTTYVAGSPWNNLNWTYGLGAVWYNFKDESGLPTNIGMSQPSKVDGMVCCGVNTGNNSGVFPDNVMAEAFGMFPGSATNVVLTGLNISKTYDITIFASLTNFPGDNTVMYTINGQTCMLNSLLNKSGTLTMFGITPDQNGQVNIGFIGAPGASFGLLGALVIKGYDGSTNQPSLPPVSNAITTLSTASVTQETPTADSTNDNKVVSAYPNPFDQFFMLTVPASNNDNVLVSMVDVNGKTIYQKRFEGLIEGTNVLRIETAATLAPGTYFVTVIYGNRTKQKMIKVVKR